ncbi:unnamed protein product [Rotaria sp. Silwood2]|nr:unnamed protein product [Rotaria sp. Silwood2]
MINSEPQTFKQEQDSNNNSRKLSVIEYSHLITLGLINVHDDYAEQFLLNTKTCLSNYIRLEINYDQLQRVIENFTSCVALSERKPISWLKENASRSLEAHTKVVRSCSANLYTAQTNTISSDVVGDMYGYDSHGQVLQRRDNGILRHLITNQITSLNIGINNKIISNFSVENESNILSLILSTCKNLNDLTIKQCFSDENLTISIYNLSSTSCVSSALTNLNIFVNIFDDCFYLLDGRLESFSILIIDMSYILL